jgi:hypothetical protein
MKVVLVLEYCIVDKEEGNPDEAKDLLDVQVPNILWSKKALLKMSLKYRQHNYSGRHEKARKVNMVLVKADYMVKGE